MSRLILIVSCLVLLAQFNTLQASSEAIQANVLGVRVVDIEGNAHHLGSGFDAKPIVILFLNTHCPIARKYIPNLNELSEVAKQNGMGFFGVISNGKKALTPLIYRRDTH